MWCSDGIGGRGGQAICGRGVFSSVVMDELHLLTAARYVELNSVRAEMVHEADEYKWSSARAHMQAQDDILVKTGPMLGMAPDWKAYLAEPEKQGEYDDFKATEKTGRPLGSESFVERLEVLLGRRLKPKKRGPRKRDRK